MRTVRLTVLLVILLTTVVGSAYAARGEGRMAPDFTLRDLNSKKVSLSDLYGDGPILISLWALWCRPCLEELPHLDEMYGEFKEQGLQVLAISQDSPRSLNKVKSYIKGKKYDFRVLTDPNGDLTRKFKTKVIPYTLILDSEGQIVHSRTGYRKGQEKELQKIVVDLLKDSAPEETD
jgi:peroxiredoxin